MSETRRVEILVPDTTGKVWNVYRADHTEETWESDVCDGPGAHDGKVWRYPLPGHAGVFLCQRCWGRENRSRYAENAYQVRYPLA